MLATNANDTRTASSLTGIGNLGQGTLVSMILHKKGERHGTFGKYAIYGDEKVHVLFWTGFQYSALIERSHRKLHEIWSQGSLFKSLMKATQEAGYPLVTLQDVAEAVQEVDEYFTHVLNAAAYQGIKTIDTGYARTWEPLQVDGQIILGAQVYVGAGDCTNNLVKGTIYIDGVKLGEKVLEPSVNGHWHAQHKPKTVAKDILKAMLPVGLYVRYSLTPDRLTEIKIGPEAAAHSKKAGIPVDPDAIRSLFKIAV